MISMWRHRWPHAELTITRPSWRQLALGYWLDAYDTEATLSIYLGPITVVVWWRRG